MTIPTSSEKFTTSPGVLRPKTRATGFSSSPPLARFVRVTQKSATPNAPTVAKRARFLMSQKRCGEVIVGVGITNDTGTSSAAGSTDLVFNEAADKESCEKSNEAQHRNRTIHEYRRIVRELKECMALDEQCRNSSKTSALFLDNEGHGRLFQGRTRLTSESCTADVLVDDFRGLERDSPNSTTTIEPTELLCA
jgi:hypothetical protein